MKLVDPEETVVLVTGTSPSAEERDRPLAYRLKAEIDRRGAGHAYRRAVVVADDWYLEHRTFHLNPTITIGGPGANGVTGELTGMLPTASTMAGTSGNVDRVPPCPPASVPCATMKSAPSLTAAFACATL